MLRRSFLSVFAPPDAALARIQALLDHWEHTCRTHLRLAPRHLPWLVFYDAEHAWHVSAESRAMKAPQSRTGAVTWSGRRFSVRRVKNTPAGVWLPDGETWPVAPGAAVKPWPKKGRKDSAAFAQIPLSSVYQSSGGISDLHWSSLALHELTHGVHFLTVVGQWRGLQRQFDMPQAADDDMIETAFARNAEYVSLFDRERKLLQQAVFANNLAAAREATRESLVLARERQRRFFQPGWTEAEALWLSLEGCALWVQIRWELDNAPPGQPWPQTAQNMAGFMGRWSQEHGAGLFWMIDQLVPDWKRRYFGGTPVPSPFDLLEQALRL